MQHEQLHLTLNSIFSKQTITRSPDTNRSHNTPVQFIQTNKHLHKQTQHKSQRRTHSSEKLLSCSFRNPVKTPLEFGHFIQKLTVFSDPVQLHSSSLPHHCKHVSSAHSLSKSPPTASAQSQWRLSPVCHITRSLNLHESKASSLNCPCSGPIGALWVKGY